jgi:hypothetical protein
VIERRDTGRFSRRSFLGGAIGGAAVITLGSPAIARAIELGPAATSTDLTYSALVEAVAPAAPSSAQAAYALAAFQSWDARITPTMRDHVTQVFSALDSGAGGSFKDAPLAERKALLANWLHPATDPLTDPDAQRRLETALEARSIAAAPTENDGAHLDDLPLGPS